MTFYAENFKRIRKSSGLTQDDVAKALNLSAGNIGFWENERCKPRIHLIPHIAELLKCKISDICDLEVNEESGYDSLIRSVLTEELKHLDINGKRRLLRTIIVYTTDNIKFRKERAAAE